MRRLIPFFAIVSTLLVGCADKNEQAAKAALTTWLDAHVARDFSKVVALTADAAFVNIAKQQKVSLKEIRRDIPDLLKLAPEKLTSYAIEGAGRRISDHEYVFTVEQKTEKQGKQRTKREDVYVGIEAGSWRVNPTRTKPAKPAAS
jgi:hypothetical protein